MGEALASTLQRKGVPSVVQRTLIRPPSSRLGPATKTERESVISESPVRGRYDENIDRKSAYEHLKARAVKEAEAESAGRTAPRRRSNRQTVTEAMVKSVVRAIGSSLGRQIVRGVLGSILKGR